MKNQNQKEKIAKKTILKVAIAIVALLVIIAIVYGSIIFINKKKRSYEIETIHDFNYYTLLKDGKTGVIDRQGNIIITPEYSTIKIPNPTKPVFICIYNYNSETGKYDIKVLNDKNEEIFKEYEES